MDYFDVEAVFRNVNRKILGFITLLHKMIISILKDRSECSVGFLFTLHSLFPFSVSVVLLPIGGDDQYFETSGYAEGDRSINKINNSSEASIQSLITVR